MLWLHLTWTLANEKLLVVRAKNKIEKLEKSRKKARFELTVNVG